MDQLKLFDPTPSIEDSPTNPIGGLNPWLGPPSSRMGYKTYINSEEWKKKASKAREMARYSCEECEKRHPHLEVHHLSYQNLYRERWNDIGVLCPTCHEEADRIRDFWTGYFTWLEKKYGKNYRRFDTLARRAEFQEWLDKKLDYF